MDLGVRCQSARLRVVGFWRRDLRLNGFRKDTTLATACEKDHTDQTHQAAQHRNFSI